MAFTLLLVTIIAHVLSAGATVVFDVNNAMGEHMVIDDDTHELTIDEEPVVFLPVCYFQAATADYVFLIDSSGSVGETGITAFRVYLASLLPVLDLPNVYGGDTRFSVRLFNISVDDSQGFSLDDNLGLGDMINVVDALPWNGGGTYTHKALRSTLDDFTRDPSIPRLVVLFQEGTYISAAKTLRATQELVAAGVRVFVVTVRPTQDISTFSSAVQTWSVDSFHDLHTLYESMVDALCSAASQR